MALFNDNGDYDSITVAQGIKLDRPPVRMVEGKADKDGVYRCILQPSLNSKGCLYALFPTVSTLVRQGRYYVDDYEGTENREDLSGLNSALEYNDKKLKDVFSAGDEKYYEKTANAAIARIEELSLEQTPLNIGSPNGLKLTASDKTVVDVRDLDALRYIPSKMGARDGHAYVEVHAYKDGKAGGKQRYSSFTIAKSFGMGAIIGTPICRGHLDVPKLQYGTSLRITFKLSVSDRTIRSYIKRSITMPRITFDMGQIDGHPFINTLTGNEIKTVNNNTSSVSFKKPITPATEGDNVYFDEATFTCRVEVPISKLFLLTIDTLSIAWELISASIGNAVKCDIGEGGLHFIGSMYFELSIVSAEPI